MTDDQIWERASIGERVELLRRRLDDMASTVDHTATIAERTRKFTRHAEIVDARDWDRLKRIEEAAKAVASFTEKFTDLDGPKPTTNDAIWIHVELVSAFVCES